ncbi:uncharacterized protein LOC105704173 [Orussus abietinus]|uniref:uncharacterized protein LOC105704173 n=1 Tax=Orussus abietinus TaxID=222816 RepID=UPI00062569A7|nr:uncharacterized protein LOC105704173 [Orussus abietinus]
MQVDKSLSIYAFALLLLFQIQIPGVISGNTVPVLMWGGGAPDHFIGSRNPLQKTPQYEFETFMKKSVAKTQPPILVYVKDNLCVEDLTQHKKVLLQLNDTGSLIYLPGVDLPMLVFEELDSYNWSSKVPDQPESLPNRNVFVTHVGDLDAVPENFKMINESTPSVLAVLTGKSCIYSRPDRRRRSVGAENSTDFIVSTDRVLLYSKEGPYIKVPESEDYIQLGKPTKADSEGEGTAENPLQLRTVFSVNSSSVSTIQLQFMFTIVTAGYYKLDYVNYNSSGASNVTVLSPKSDIVFPFNFSYHCSQNTVFINKSAVLNITNLQVQIDATKFNDAYDCVGFTTIPIWTGIFVTIILATIMIWGLIMIIDIHTMDRFDDPKGKTITISAQE